MKAKTITKKQQQKKIPVYKIGFRSLDFIAAVRGRVGDLGHYTVGSGNMLVFFQYDRL